MIDELKTIRLAIGVLAYGGSVVAYQAQMWLAFGRALTSFGSRFEHVMGMFVDINGVHRARNRLLAEAMKANTDWLFMIDADTWVEAHNASSGFAAGHALLRMIDDADQAGIAIVAAPVVMRSSSSYKGIAAFRKNAEGKYEQLKDSPLHALQDVDEVGAACMAINLHKIHDDIEFRAHDLASEDRDFCRQVRTHGHRIALDGRVRTGHLSQAFPLYSE